MRFQQASPHVERAVRLLTALPVVTEELYGAYISGELSKDILHARPLDAPDRHLEWRKRSRLKLGPLAQQGGPLCRFSLPFPHPWGNRFRLVDDHTWGYDFNVGKALYNPRLVAWYNERVGRSRSSGGQVYTAAEYRMRFGHGAPAVWLYARPETFAAFVIVRLVCPATGAEWGSLTVPQQDDVVTPWAGQPAQPRDEDGPRMYGLVRTGPREYVLPVEDAHPAPVDAEDEHRWALRHFHSLVRDGSRGDVSPVEDTRPNADEHRSALRRTLGELTLRTHRALERVVAVANDYLTGHLQDFKYYPDHRFTYTNISDGQTVARVYGAHPRSRLVDPFSERDIMRLVRVEGHIDPGQIAGSHD